MVISTKPKGSAIFRHQFQSPQPVWHQDQIPAGVHDIELSWDGKARADGGYFRVILRGLSDDPDALVHHPHHQAGAVHPHTWWWKEYLGRAQVIGTDSREGRMHLRAMLRISGETLTMYRPPDAIPHPVVEGIERPATHNRLCYRRETQEWRLRDERRPDMKDALVFTKNYVGDLNAEKNVLDSVAHIYHNGWTVIDSDHVAHLYDPLINY